MSKAHQLKTASRHNVPSFSHLSPRDSYLEGIFFVKKGKLVERADLAAYSFLEDSESEEDFELGPTRVKLQTKSTLEDEDRENSNYFEIEKGERNCHDIENIQGLSNNQMPERREK